jgi:hypothetical protein
MCHAAILKSIEPLPCTTSSCEYTVTKFSEYWYSIPKVRSVMVEAAHDGLLREVAERVVHQAHVPLVVEAEAALLGRPAHQPANEVLSSAIIATPGW